jgi:omega-6 fatty acid desaturase (delta-12 desaturase)
MSCHRHTRTRKILLAERRPLHAVLGHVDERDAWSQSARAIRLLRIWPRCREITAPEPACSPRLPRFGVEPEICNQLKVLPQRAPRAQRDRAGKTPQSHLPRNHVAKYLLARSSVQQEVQRRVMPTHAEWQAAIAPFRAPIQRAATMQLLNTVIPYVLCTALAYGLCSIAYWAATPFIVLAGLFTVRSFIISHDCSHGSFTASKRLNDRIGFWTGLIAFTPYLQWRRSHAIHHADSGNVGNDGTGYFWSQTTSQYQASSFLRRCAYRAYRSPLLLLGLGGPWLFLIEYRLFDRDADACAKRQVCAVNALWLAFACLIWLTLGPMALLKVQLPIALIGSLLGVWLFYFQHHYPDAYFARDEEWDFTRAALEGSSFLKLPRWLQFFSGNIGFHHIHHLSPKVPNYRLEACHEAVPFLRAVAPLTRRDCAEAIRFALIDSETGRWTTFRRSARAARAHPARTP